VARADRARAIQAPSMTFLVDANVAVYAHVPSRFHDACLRIIDAVAAGVTPGRMSTSIFEEVWHVELSGKARPTEGMARRMYVLFKPLLLVTDDIVARALDVRAPRLGANDRIHAATALVYGIPIVSADAAFDTVGGLRRIDPLDERELLPLLRG
jgi:predicted nucleic acid-binding protein